MVDPRVGRRRHRDAIADTLTYFRLAAIEHAPVAILAPKQG